MRRVKDGAMARRDTADRVDMRGSRLRARSRSAAHAAPDAEFAAESVLEKTQRFGWRAFTERTVSDAGPKRGT